MDKLALLKSFFQNKLPTHIYSGVDYLADKSGDLSPCELSSHAFYSPIRVQEFSTGRSIAKLLLKEAGAPRTDLLSDSNGLVAWPTGFIGSITHKKNLCAVIISKTSEAKSVGLDIEVSSPMDATILTSILTNNEIKKSTGMGLSDAAIANLYLSAKESFYKYQYPLTKLRFDFHDIELSISLEKSSFHLASTKIKELEKSERLMNFSSRIGIFNDLICTACFSN